MTQVSNDPGAWPTINMARVLSYFIVASSTAVIYDWALMFGQELELVWRRRWSPMTFLYLGVRYIGILFSVINILALPSVSLTDVCLTMSGTILNVTVCWTVVVVGTMLCAIMIARLHAMYRRSRKILIFLVVSFLPSLIICVVFAVQQSTDTWEELVLSGTYQCINEGYNQLLLAMAWIVSAVWQMIALCLAVRVVVIHFRELQGMPTRRSIGEVLMKTHVFYFAAYAAASFIALGILSPVVKDSSSAGAAIFFGVFSTIELMQMFVLGPRLIISVREYHAELVADSDAGTVMIAIDFQERLHVTTGSGV